MNGWFVRAAGLGKRVWLVWWMRYDRAGHGLLGVLTPGRLLAGLAGLWGVWLFGGWLVLLTGWHIGHLLVGLVLATLLGFGCVRVWGWFMGSQRGEGFYRSGRQVRCELLGRDGLADARQVARAVGSEQLLGKARWLRPKLAVSGKPVTPSDLGWRVGVSRGVDVWASVEQPEYLVGPARSGKGRDVVINAIVEAPGAVVTTSTRTDNLLATYQARRGRGPAYLFNPQSVGGLPSTLRWSPILGCENPVVAQRHATTLVAATGMAKGENAPWASAATGVLQALLHAAALSGATIDRLHEWTSSPSRAAEAAEVLKGAGSVEGWEELIRSVLEDDPRILGSKFFGVTEAFRALDTATTRQTFDTSGGATDLEELLLSGGTLYMLSRWRDESGGEVTVGGLQALLLDDLVDTARRISQRDGSRLDPPVTLVLDEVANCFQWARLPQVMAAGSGEGVKALVVFQSRAQAKASYGAESEKTMWDNANRLLLGGSASVDDLKDLSLLAGEREQHRRSHSSSGGWLDNRGQSWSDQVHDKPVLGVDDLSRLPDRVDAMLAKGARLILVDLEPWQERPWAHLVPPQDQWDTLAKEGLFR